MVRAIAVYDDYSLFPRLWPVIVGGAEGGALAFCRKWGTRRFPVHLTGTQAAFFPRGLRGSVREEHECRFSGHSRNKAFCISCVLPSVRVQADVVENGS